MIENSNSDDRGRVREEGEEKKREEITLSCSLCQRNNMEEGIFFLFKLWALASSFRFSTFFPCDAVKSDSSAQVSINTLTPSYLHPQLDYNFGAEA